MVLKMNLLEKGADTVHEGCTARLEFSATYQNIIIMPRKGALYLPHFKKQQHEITSFNVFFWTAIIYGLL